MFNLTDLEIGIELIIDELCHAKLTNARVRKGDTNNLCASIIHREKITKRPASQSKPTRSQSPKPQDLASPLTHAHLLFATSPQPDGQHDRRGGHVRIGE